MGEPILSLWLCCHLDAECMFKAIANDDDDDDDDGDDNDDDDDDDDEWGWGLGWTWGWGWAWGWGWIYCLKCLHWKAKKVVQKQTPGLTT